MFTFSRISLLLLPLATLAALQIFPSNSQSPQHVRLPAKDRDPALTQMLAKLQENEVDYKRQIPNIFCQESVDSEFRGKSFQKTKTVSTFRLRRVDSSSPEPLLEEIRTLRLKDGKPVNGETLDAPAVLDGVFSRGLDPVRTADRSCFQYSFRDVPKNRAKSTVIIHFDLLPATERDADCPSYDGASGQAWIDLQSTRITRIEMQIPHHEFGKGIIANWRWTATYAPQELKDQKFWLPLVIESTATPSDGSKEWRFTAHYNDYHLLHVESRILRSQP